MDNKNPFIFLNEILNGKNPQMVVDEESSKDYNAFLTNRGLSYHIDCIFQVNEVNRMHNLPPNMQYAFLYNSIRKHKRKYQMWGKNTKSDASLIIAKAFSCSRKKAEEYLKILSEDDLKIIVETLDEGGA